MFVVSLPDCDSGCVRINGDIKNSQAPRQKADAEEKQRTSNAKHRMIRSSMFPGNLTTKERGNQHGSEILGFLRPLVSLLFKPLPRRKV
jgi:hypothetical protein